jgi:hypothetical protein
MSEPAPHDPPNRRAPLTVWRAVHAFLTTLFHIFGAPEEVAARHTLTLKDHQRMVPWLRAAEALMRRMIFIEAALLTSETQAPIAKAALKKSAHPRRVVGFDAEHPERWRVSFRCFEAARHRGARSATHCRDTKTAPGFRSAWPIAERLEALLRACNDPLPYAKRLAQRLRKTAKLVARFSASWREHRDIVGRSLHNALVSPISAAAAVFNSS